MNKSLANILFTAFIFILFTAAAFEALTFSRLAQFFPLYISIAGSVLALIYLIKIIIAHIKETSPEERYEQLQILKPFRYIEWVLAYLLLMYVYGMFIASTVFLFVFLICESNITILL